MLPRFSQVQNQWKRETDEECPCKEGGRGVLIDGGPTGSNSWEPKEWSLWDTWIKSMRYTQTHKTRARKIAMTQETMTQYGQLSIRPTSSTSLSS